MKTNCTGTKFCECIKCEAILHGMQSDGFFILKHNKSGIKYILHHKEGEKWLLSCNNGEVPNQQMVYGKTANEIAKGINCKVIL